MERVLRKEMLLESLQGGQWVSSQLALSSLAIVMQVNHLLCISSLLLLGHASGEMELLEEVAGEDVIERRPVLGREIQQ
jgi:hypothetical protein